jgi:heat shock protein HslJ
MKTTIRILTLISAGILLVACDMGTTTTAPATPTQPPGQSLTAVGDNKLAGTGWTLATLNGQPASADTIVTLNFGAGLRANGSDGCNSYNAAYIADEKNIRFQTPFAGTMMACPQPIMKQATDFMKALEQAATYQIQGSRLTLSDASGKELATFDAQSTDLAGTSWDVTSYNNGKQAVVSVISGTSLTATFDKEGSVAGSAGCNNYNAAYESDGKSKINIGPAISTMMMCSEPAGVMDQEQQYLQALESAATYRIDGDMLEIRTAEDAIAATFQKKARP